MRFKVGDLVRVINESLSAYNAIGKIIDIDEEWHLPYEVEFIGEYKEELFYESDLALEEDADINDLSIEGLSPMNYIDIKFQEGTFERNGVNGARAEDVIDVLIDKLESFHSSDRQIDMAITHLMEAQNWLYRRNMKRKEG